ncbi:MAG: FtsX-like permease family protein [Mycobacteriales bacterium]
MRAVLAWLRLDLRRRARSLVALGLLLALSGGLVLAVTAGARRNGSALDRLREDSLPATAIVLPNQPGFDWAKVRTWPEVEALGQFSLNAVYGIDGVNTDDVSFPSASADFYTKLERPAILSGRMFDNTRADEVMVSRPFLSKYHKKVGDSLVARLFTPQQMDAALATGSPNAPPVSTAKGPRQTMRIVGVGRVPWLYEFGGGEDAGIIPPYGFYQRYQAELTGTHPEKTEVINSLVRLRGGSADLPRFRADLARLTGSNVDAIDLADGGRRVTNATSFEKNSLLLFALVAALAALLIVGQAIVRYVGSAIVDLEVLRALGLTRRESVAAAMAGPALAAAGAAVVAVVLAYAGSSRFPIGVGATVEPAPGLNADWLVLLAGAALLVVLVTLISYFAAVAALGRRAADRPARRSAAAALASRLGLPVPITLGTRLALEAGRGRTSVPVRPAMVGAIAGVLGVVAATTFHTGLIEAVQNPERYGQTYQAIGYAGFNGQNFATAEELRSGLAGLAAQPQVAGVNDSRLAPVTIHGASADAWELTPIGGGVSPVSIEGREPRADDEIAVAPKTAHDLKLKVGQRIQVKGEKTLSLRISGITFVPQGPHSTYDDGVWVRGGTMTTLYPSGFFKFHLILARFHAGVDADKASAALNRTFPFELSTGSPPADVLNLRTVRTLPTLLGAFLALLAVGAVGHALATAVRRRQHDVAVLRALGLTRPQVRGTVAWQATTLAIVGLLFGIPLGVALARTMWRVVAERTPVQYVPPIAILVLLLVGPLSVLVVNLLAAYPGHRAVRLRIGTVLRAE